MAEREMPDIAVGDDFIFGNYVRAVVRHIYREHRPHNGAHLSAVIGPHNPAAYDFKWEDGKWELIDNPAGGSYIRPGHQDWIHAVKLRQLAGIKNPGKY